MNALFFQEFDILFEDFGGFDGLYLRMLACGIPTAVQLMWIPMSELSIYQQLLLVTRICYQCLTVLWKSRIVRNARSTIMEILERVNGDILVFIVFPAVEFIIPYPVKFLSLLFLFALQDLCFFCLCIVAVLLVNGCCK